MLLILPLAMPRGIPAIPDPLKAAIAALFMFAGYAAFANLVWGVLLIDHEITKVGALGFAAFYLFNALVFASCVVLYVVNKNRFILVTIWSTVAALLLQFALFAARGGAGGFREKLFFNNPNQLGYYALLCATLVAFGFQRARVPVWLAGSSLAITALLAALSLSKAAIIGTVVVAFVAAIRKPVLLAVTALVMLLATQARDPAALVDKLVLRMTDLGEQGDDTLEGRGYSRIEMHPEYLVLGAGEVGHDRHGDFGGELHSSWATTLFSYGVVGLALLLVFLWRALRLLRPADWLFLVPIFWYGFTHQGMRFRLFWAFIAFVCVATYHAHLIAARRISRLRSRPVHARSTQRHRRALWPLSTSLPHSSDRWARH
ncbi:MAG: hypothetical protein IT383_18910 [Deltaproteobacteria bacterium]|nr:hypothetical protein [Deltaproteobacteria bacterium]